MGGFRGGLLDYFVKCCENILKYYEGEGVWGGGMEGIYAGLICLKDEKKWVLFISICIICLDRRLLREGCYF